MDFNEYQALAKRTAPDGNKKNNYVNFALGISGEAGETTDLIKKHIFHGHYLDRDELIKELGDVLWYLSNLATTANIQLNEVATLNVEKLKKRYPNGFNVKDSIKHVDVEQ